MSKDNIPDKLTFTRKEVSLLTKLDGKVLDFWEKEFAAFVPVINRSQEKFYTRQDLEIILAIRQWLIVEKKDKNEVKKLIAHELGNVPPKNARANDKEGEIAAVTLKKIRHQLKEILTLLDKNDTK
jgi:DNA-binding transcriptional MerR regulator